MKLYVSNSFTFSSASKSRTGIYNITKEIVKKSLKDTVMVLLLEEDGWLYRGDKMEVLTLTKAGQITKMDLVASLVNYGMAFNHCIASLIKHSGRCALTLL